MKQFTLLTAFLCFVCIGLNAQVQINEIMQSNIDCVMDDLNEFPDSWVELYNSSESSVSLGNYKIGISSNVSEAWTLPYNTTIGAKSYLLIYCDKEGKKLHTDFRLDSGKGGSVYLFKGTTVVDKLTGLAKQPAPNISYGRQSENSNEWGYQQTPTPNKANCGKLCTKILGEPVFSIPGKVVRGSTTINLTISLPSNAPEGTEIRVTYDGSEPTQASTLFSNNSAVTIRSTKIVRAKLFCDGYLSPRATTHSYIFFPRTLTLPVVSLVTDNKYFNDSKIGIYVDGSYSSSKKNYEYDWRRPINFEFFEDANVESSLNQLCETRIQGGATRSNALKSLAVYANKRFGEKRLEYEFFPDQKPGLKEFKSIILRNAGNDFDYLYMRDAIMQRTMASHVDLDWQAWRPVIFYLNGTYKGMLNIRERSNEDNIYTNYDGLEDIDMIENWGELKEGTWKDFEEFKKFYNESGHSWSEYNERMDCIEFINLMIMNIYFNNQDFPGNNIVQWRPIKEGGRWRWIAKDTDFGMGLYGSSATYKTFEWLYNPNYDKDRAWGNKPEHTILFRNLMETSRFKREFIDRFAIYMGDFLNFDGTWEVWEPMYNMIKTEYPEHRKLINQWWPTYSDELNNAKSWVKSRTAEMYSQIASKYSLAPATPMTINKALTADELSGCKIEFNDVELSKGKFDGKFYRAREVRLKGKPVGNKCVTGWNVVTTFSNGATTTVEIIGDEYEFTMPQCTKIEINAIVETIPIPGDANGDGKVDVSDITAIAAYILGKNPTPFRKDNADANGDGTIDVSDITATAGIILGR